MIKINEIWIPKFSFFLNEIKTWNISKFVMIAFVKRWFLLQHIDKAHFDKFLSLNSSYNYISPYSSFLFRNPVNLQHKLDYIWWKFSLNFALSTVVDHPPYASFVDKTNLDLSCASNDVISWDNFFEGSYLILFLKTIFSNWNRTKQLRKIRSGVRGLIHG